VREYLFVLVFAAAVTYLLTPVVRSLAVYAGALTPVRDRDVHAVPTPRLGGTAMFAGFAAALAVAAQLPRLSSMADGSTDLQAVLLGAGLVCLLGVADDIWGLDAITKFAGQVLAAGVMASQGVQLLSLPIFGVTYLPDTGDGHDHGAAGRGHDERGQLRRRPGRPGRRHRRASRPPASSRTRTASPRTTRPTGCSRSPRWWRSR
jgi:hypothetical protein